jgi:hypothetical protein
MGLHQGLGLVVTSTAINLLIVLLLWRFVDTAISRAFYFYIVPWILPALWAAATLWLLSYHELNVVALRRFWPMIILPLLMGLAGWWLANLVLRRPKA